MLQAALIAAARPPPSHARRPPTKPLTLGTGSPWAVLLLHRGPGLRRLAGAAALIAATDAAAVPLEAVSMCLLRWGPAELAACGGVVRLAGNTAAAGTAELLGRRETGALRFARSGLVAMAGSLLMAGTACRLELVRQHSHETLQGSTMVGDAIPLCLDATLCRPFGLLAHACRRRGHPIEHVSDCRLLQQSMPGCSRQGKRRCTLPAVGRCSGRPCLGRLPRPHRGTRWNTSAPEPPPHHQHAGCLWFIHLFCSAEKWVGADL